MIKISYKKKFKKDVEKQRKKGKDLQKLSNFLKVFVITNL
jgi:mRNA-degrading endonuclease YafQ of YafQ-DinJ toxin-antitoxin module